MTYTTPKKKSLETRKLKLINFQASVSITYATIFTQGKEITSNEEIWVNLFLSKQYYVTKRKQQNFRKILNDIRMIFISR